MKLTAVFHRQPCFVRVSFTMASDKSTSPGSIAFSPINTALASNTPNILAQARALASMTPANQLQASVSPGAVSGYQSPFAASDAANSNRSELASPKFVGPQVEHLNFTIEEVQAIKDKQHDLYQDFWILRDNWANKDSPSNVKSLNKIDDRRLEKIFLLGKNLQHLVGLTTEIYEKFAGGETILKKVADSMESKKNAFAKELDDLILAACNLRRRLEGSGHKYDAPVEFKVIGNQVHVPKTKKKNTKRGLTPASLSEDITLDTSAEFLGLIPASEPPRKKRAMGDGRTIVKIGPKRNAQRVSFIFYLLPPPQLMQVRVHL